MDFSAGEASSDALVLRACEILSKGCVAVLSGAGISTDSGIPDYRGAGSLPRSPMRIDSFRANPSARQRYWLGAHLGWSKFSQAEPNAGHLAVAGLEHAGIIDGVVTQNVDRLHREAGSLHVIDLHGDLSRVMCMDCGQVYDRSTIEERLTALNPWIESEAIDLAGRINPDGDVDVVDYARMVVPDCTVCAGVLKPDVVFFGEFVPVKTFAAATQLVKRAKTLLVLGSSLAVNSGIRLVELARKTKQDIIVVNRGETKIDQLATVRIDGGTSEFLSAVLADLGVGYVLEDIE